MAQRSWTFLALILGLLASPTSDAAQKIGIASAVKNSVESVLGGSRSVIKVGDGLFENQTVETADDATAQLLFSDETTMTVGPRSAVVLDKFVYNPQTRTGEVVLNATKGAFRFISGAARPDTYKIKTPIATIGVRGTIVDGYCDTGGNCFFIVQEGEAEFRLANGQVIVAKAGTFVHITASGTISTGTFDGSMFSIPATGVSFPLFGWSFQFDDLQEIGNFDPNEFNEALEQIVPVPVPKEKPEEEELSLSE